MLFHVVLMVSVGLNYILQVAFELSESQWVQRLALSLTFSPYTFQSLTLTSVTTLLPCWKLGYRVCFNLAEKLFSIAETKEVPLTQLNSDGGT